MNPEGSPDIDGCPDFLQKIREFKQLTSRYQRSRDLISVGAYAPEQVVTNEQLEQRYGFEEGYKKDIKDGKILLVDDEPDILEFVSYNLKKEGFIVYTAGNGKVALQIAKKEIPDLIILDVNLPKLDGFAILEKVRESAPTQPIIMISARTDKDDVTHGLRLGADDYVRKPFSIEELVLRIENRLKRNTSSAAEIFYCGPISLNDSEHEVKFNDEVVDLSPTEYNLLLMLIRNQNRVMTKEKLLDLVWGLDFETSTNVVDTYISYLRKKLHKDGFDGIKTIRGIGFQIKAK